MNTYDITPSERERVTHDYTVREWGHDYTYQPIDGGLKGKMVGWGVGIEPGDYLILPNRDTTTRVRVDRIGYHLDPPDMWEADVSFAPRDRMVGTP